MNLVRVCDDECKGCAICVSCVPRDVSPCLANSMPRATNMSVSSRIPLYCLWTLFPQLP
jgi:hypothetical protein